MTEHTQQEVNLTLGGRSYRLQVPAAQAPRLQRVAEQAENLIATMRTQLPDIERDRLWALVVLQMADDLMTCRAERETERTMVANVCGQVAEKIEKMVK